MNKQPTNGKQTQAIEKEYINTMLNVDCHNISEKEIFTGNNDEQSIPNQKSPIKKINHNVVYENSEIKCSVFNVEGLNIALPSINIMAILKQQTIQLNKTKQHLMYLGYINYDNNIIKIIDLAFLVMDDVNGFKKLTKNTDNSIDIILLKNCSIGFICSKTTTQNILNKQVCWRDKTSERIWLAGTVIQMGFSLLDINGVIKLLNNNN